MVMTDVRLAACLHLEGIGGLGDPPPPIEDGRQKTIGFLGMGPQNTSPKKNYIRVYYKWNLLKLSWGFGFFIAGK